MYSSRSYNGVCDNSTHKYSMNYGSNPLMTISYPQAIPLYPSSPWNFEGYHTDAVRCVGIPSIASPPPLPISAHTSESSPSSDMSLSPQKGVEISPSFEDVDNIVTTVTTPDGIMDQSCETASTASSPPGSYNATKKKDKSKNSRFFSCTFEGCAYKSSRQSNLTTHMRHHTGERPYKCSFSGCSFSSAQSSNLRVHEKTHSGHRPFKCKVSGCVYAAAQHSLLPIHMRKVHGITETSVRSSTIQNSKRRGNIGGDADDFFVTENKIESRRQMFVNHKGVGNNFIFRPRGGSARVFVEKEKVKASSVDVVIDMEDMNGVASLLSMMKKRFI